MWLYRRLCAAPHGTMLGALSRSSEPSSSRSTTMLSLTWSHASLRWWENTEMRCRWEQIKWFGWIYNRERKCSCGLHIFNLKMRMCVSGLCDGGAVNTGVSSGESSRMSEKHRPYGCSDQVYFCDLIQGHLSNIYSIITFTYCAIISTVFIFTGHPHQTLLLVTNWWTERAQVNWTSLAQDLLVCRHNATNDPTRSPKSLVNVATSWVIPHAVQLWIAYKWVRDSCIVWYKIDKCFLLLLMCDLLFFFCHYLVVVFDGETEVPAKIYYLSNVLT